MWRQGSCCPCARTLTRSLARRLQHCYSLPFRRHLARKLYQLVHFSSSARGTHVVGWRLVWIRQNESHSGLTRLESLEKVRQTCDKGKHSYQQFFDRFYDDHSTCFSLLEGETGSVCWPAPLLRKTIVVIETVKAVFCALCVQDSFG